MRRLLRAEEFRKILTPRRLDLWRAIRDQHPPSVLGLCHLVQRDQKSVHRDLDLLVALGIVALEAGAGNAVRPVALLNSIRLDIR